MSKPNGPEDIGFKKEQLGLGLPAGTAETPEGAGKCRSCGAPIVWVTMAKTGKQMPVNPPFRSYVTQGGEVVQAGVSHFATCPAAAEHRKGADRGKAR